MGNTNENLKEAFAGESQANRKYLFFADKADQEGYRHVARLFRAAAAAETVHAKNHLRELQGIGSTADNLKAAVGGELYEFTEMYPQFIGQAEAEGEAKAKNSFDMANRVEQVHHGLFEAALAAIEEEKGKDGEPFHVCRVCGYTVEGEAPDKCPVCGATKKAFDPVE
ncbi:MAG: rubrerythrin family protein [Chloroflexota bacterium]|nr:rubrerythrin family protein [Chloroflexota bacterium]